MNSYHDDGILQADLAPNLRATAVCPVDGMIEALLHPEAPVAAIQWHPERDNPASTFDQALFKQMFGSP